MQPMAKLVAKLMLLLCAWNITVSSLPAFSASFVEDGIHQSGQSKDPCVQGGEVVDSHSEDCECDPNNCENERCKFHQCHLGHCNFVVKDVVASAIIPQTISLIPAAEWIVQSVFVLGLIRPPSVQS